MITIEITETALNQLVRQTDIVDEILLVRRGEQVARLLPPEATGSSPMLMDSTSGTTERAPKFFVAEDGDAMERKISD